MIIPFCLILYLFFSIFSSVLCYLSCLPSYYVFLPPPFFVTNLKLNANATIMQVKLTTLALKSNML